MVFESAEVPTEQNRQNSARTRAPTLYHTKILVPHGNMRFLRQKARIVALGSRGPVVVESLKESFLADSPGPCRKDTAKDGHYYYALWP